MKIYVDGYATRKYIYLYGYVYIEMSRGGGTERGIPAKLLRQLYNKGMGYENFEH